MQWSWVVTTPAVTEPLSLADAKEHLKVDTADDDSLITAQILAARKWIEQYCNRSLPSQTLTAYFDTLPNGYLMLPQSPCISVTSINYVDTDGNIQVWDSSKYDVDTSSVPARIFTSYGESWPSVRSQMNAVNVVYVAGQSSVDEDIVHALKLMVGSLYAARENDCPFQSYQPSFSVKALLAHHRVFYRGPWV